MFNSNGCSDIVLLPKEVLGVIDDGCLVNTYLSALSEIYTCGWQCMELLTVSDTVKVYPVLSKTQKYF